MHFNQGFRRKIGDRPPLLLCRAIKALNEIDIFNISRRKPEKREFNQAKHDI